MNDFDFDFFLILILFLPFTSLLFSFDLPDKIQLGGVGMLKASTVPNKMTASCKS